MLLTMEDIVELLGYYILAPKPAAAPGRTAGVNTNMKRRWFV
jgi:hypothetical protein